MKVSLLIRLRAILFSTLLLVSLFIDMVIGQTGFDSLRTTSNVNRINSQKVVSLLCVNIPFICAITDNILQTVTISNSKSIDLTFYNEKINLNNKIDGNLTNLQISITRLFISNLTSIPNKMIPVYCNDVVHIFFSDVSGIKYRYVSDWYFQLKTYDAYSPTISVCILKKIKPPKDIAMAFDLLNRS